MASFVYNQAKAKLGDGTIDFDGANIKTLLLKGSASGVNKDHDSVGVILNNTSEADVTGYSRQSLANAAVTVDDASDLAKYDADDTTYTSLSSGNTIVGEVIYHNSSDGSDGLNTPIAFVDFSDTATDGNNFKVQYSADGIFEIA